MYLLITISLLLLTSSYTTAQSTSTPCISNCPLISSECNGDETGMALDQCTCDTYESAAGTDLINCVKTCPAAEQSIFAANVPTLCRSQLFPGVSVAASSSTVSSTTGAGQGSTTSASPGPTTGTGGQTSQTTTPSPAAAGNLAAPGLAAAGGLLVAVFL